MANEKVMWSRNGLVVTAKVADDGELTIYGHDLSGAVYEEYEYWLTVPATGTPAITRALGGPPPTTSCPCWKRTANR